MTDRIPLVDLGWQHRIVAEEVEAGFDAIMQSGAFIQSGDVDAFEQAFAAFCGVNWCVGVANGTDALELALRALDIGAGAEVIVPANTFIATAEAALRAGATVVLADCDDDYLIDPERVADQIGPRTRAIMPVHLYGQIAPMTELRALADRHGLAIVEDAAQAQGARQHGVAAGGFGAAAGTSFYPGKNLGAYGDAGAVLTPSEPVARRLRALRNHGGVIRYVHEEVGVNSRLDSLQAVVLKAKLAHLEQWNELRRQAAARYGVLLRDLADAGKVRLPRAREGNLHVWHLYVVRVDHRDEVLATLQNAGIGAGIHYPAPVHLLPAFAFLGKGPGSFPVAEAAGPELLTLPLYPGITEAQQARVADVLTKAIG